MTIMATLSKYIVSTMQIFVAKQNENLKDDILFLVLVLNFATCKQS